MRERQEHALRYSVGLRQIAWKSGKERRSVWLPIDPLYVLGAYPKFSGLDSPHRLDIAGQRNTKL